MSKIEKLAYECLIFENEIISISNKEKEKRRDALAKAQKMAKLASEAARKLYEEYISS